jgi:hypothetical protein
VVGWSIPLRQVAVGDGAERPRNGWEGAEPAALRKDDVWTYGGQ